MLRSKFSGARKAPDGDISFGVRGHQHGGLFRSATAS